ncbi:MAG: bile acid:sodium symporter family protein [Pseudomonadota bacterium]
MDFLTEVALPLSLAIIMLSLGLGLTFQDFARVAQRPTAFLIGAAHQIILLPLVAFGVASVFGLAGAIAVGFMILAFSPGGVTTNMLAKLANGDVALSVSLTAVISLTSVLTLPVLLAWAVDHFMGQAAPPVDILGVAISMFLITVVPIVLGLLLRWAFPVAIGTVEPIMDIIAKVLFVVIVVAALAANWALFIEHVATLGPALIVLCGLLLVLGLMIPRLLGRSWEEAKTVSVETGIQNATLALAVAAIISGGQGISEFAIPGAVYGIIMYLVALPMIFALRRRGV